MLVAAFDRLGSRWSAIAKHIEGRSDNAIKNNWHSLRSKGLLGLYRELGHGHAHKYNQLFGAPRPQFVAKGALAPKKAGARGSGRGRAVPPPTTQGPPPPTTKRHHEEEEALPQKKAKVAMASPQEAPQPVRVSARIAERQQRSAEGEGSLLGGLEAVGGVHIQCTPADSGSSTLSCFAPAGAFELWGVPNRASPERVARWVGM